MTRQKTRLKVEIKPETPKKPALYCFVVPVWDRERGVRHLPLADVASIKYIHTGECDGPYRKSAAAAKAAARVFEALFQNNEVCIEMELVDEGGTALKRNGEGNW